jgi:hypothetical protein
MLVMSGVLLFLNLLCAILILCGGDLLCSGPAFALGPVVSQALAASQTGKAVSIPQEGHAVEPGGNPSSAGDAASNATDDTLVIPRHYQTIQDPLAPVNEKSFSVKLQRVYNADARPQRLLWASAGTKDPLASDVLYVKR